MSGAADGITAEKSRLRATIEYFYGTGGWTVEELARAARCKPYQVRNLIIRAINAGRIAGPYPELEAVPTRPKKRPPAPKPKPITRKLQQLRQLPKKVQRKIRQGAILFPAGVRFQAPKAIRLPLLEGITENTTASNLPVDLERGNHGEMDC